MRVYMKHAKADYVSDVSEDKKGKSTPVKREILKVTKKRRRKKKKKGKKS